MNIALKSILGVLAVALLGWFAFAHFDQFVEIDFALFTVRHVPLPIVIYGSVLVGMLIMVGVGFWSDHRKRESLKPPQEKSTQRVLTPDL